MWEEQLEIAKELAEKAGRKIMEYYRGYFDVEIKDDDSPVTSADFASNKIITTCLKEKYPTYAILSEEIADDLSRLNNDFVWIIDPLDGTKDFVEHGDGFAVNIALAYKHELVIGVVYVPVTEELFYASKSSGSYYQKGNLVTKIHVNDKITDLTCLISKHFFNDREKETIEKHSDRIKNYYPAGASIKPCLIAKGEAEISYRLSSSTKEWDTAAPQIVLEEAGGLVRKIDGSKITYNNKDVHIKQWYMWMNREENFLL